MTTSGETILEEIVAGLDKLNGTVGGKWTLGYRGADIGCENAKDGGYAKLFDVRGWGYLTGHGHADLA